MKKRLLSLLLTLVMLVGMIPATSLTVHAYSTITDIDVNITEPVVGQMPVTKVRSTSRVISFRSV